MQNGVTDQYERFKRHRSVNPRSGQIGSVVFGSPEVGAPPGAVGLSGFTQDASLTESVTSLISTINAWTAAEGSRVHAYRMELAALSTALSQFNAIPAISSEFGSQITDIISALVVESNRASRYLDSVGFITR